MKRSRRFDLFPLCCTLCLVILFICSAGSAQRPFVTPFTFPTFSSFGYNNGFSSLFPYSSPYYGFQSMTTPSLFGGMWGYSFTHRYEAPFGSLRALSNLSLGAPGFITTPFSSLYAPLYSTIPPQPEPQPTPPPPADPVPDINLDASSNGGAIFLLEGDVLCVNLDSNPSTGSIWHLDPNALDPNVLEKITDTFTPDNDLPGSGGTDKWYFMGLAPGSTTIAMEYKRPWITEPSDTFTIEVTIPDVSIDASRNGETVPLQKGDILCISLDSNPSTGYHWALDPNFFDPNVLTKLENVFVSSAPGRPGAGGTERWFFAASAPGKTPIYMSYQAP